MSTTSYTPGIGNLPFGNLNANPQASEYALESNYSPAEEILIAKAIKREIFDAAPKQYNALKLLFEKSYKEVGSDEFEYLEKTFNRSALTSNAIVAAVPAAGTAPAAQTLTLLAASMTHLTPDLIIIYPNNTKAVIRSVPSATTIAVESISGGSLPAVAVGDVFAVQSTIEADAMDYFSNYQRLETITRFNYIQFFLRAARWGRVELQKYDNQGTTDYLINDKNLKMEQLRVDLFNSFFNGQRGEFRISNGYIAKSTGGIYPTMVAAGSATSNPTVAGLVASFKQLAFNTNYKQEGATRFIYGTQEMLHILSGAFKDAGLRYAPNDTIASMDLKEYEFGGMKFVPVACELFRESSCFPADWKRKLLVLDQETITPVKMKGIPATEAGQTLTRGANGTRENFQDFWVGAQLGVEMNNPLSSFWIDVQ